MEQQASSMKSLKEIFHYYSILYQFYDYFGNIEDYVFIESKEDVFYNTIKTYKNNRNNYLMKLVFQSEYSCNELCFCKGENVVVCKHGVKRYYWIDNRMHYVHGKVEEDCGYFWKEKELE